MVPEVLQMVKEELEAAKCQSPDRCRIDEGTLNWKVLIVIKHEKAGGTDMSSLPEQLAAGAGGTFVTSTWLRRFLIALTVLAWMVIVEMVYSFFGIIGTPIILLLLAAIVAYVLYPLVKGLSRFIPLALAIALVYLLVFGALFFVVYFMLAVVIARTDGTYPHRPDSLSGLSKRELSTIYQFSDRRWSYAGSDQVVGAAIDRGFRGGGWEFSPAAGKPFHVLYLYGGHHIGERLPAG